MLEPRATTGATPRVVRVARVGLVCAGLAACGPAPPGSDGCQVELLPGDLVITEVFADYRAAAGTGGIDTGREWFEIYNATERSIDLTGLTITNSRPDGSKPNRHVMTGATIGPGQYVTLGNAAGALPPYIDYSYGADLGELFNSGGGKLALSCGEDGREVDRAIYDGVAQGHSRELTGAQPPDYTLNDQPDSWCEARDTEFEAGNFGTPGSDNDCRPIIAGQCNDGGTPRSAVAPGPGDLVITEVMPSPEGASDAMGEWFEARVMTDVDLNGVGLDRAGDTSKPDLLVSADCLRVRAGSHVVFARSADPAVNGGLPRTSIAGTFRFSLVAGAPGAPGDVAILAGQAVVDAVRWTRTTAGKALQLDPDLVDPIANDSESNFCDATAPYNQPAGAAPDLGTPGAPNTQCLLLPGAGRCDDGGAARAIVKPAPGALVISEVLANPANVATGPTDAQREWFEVANTGATAFDLNELSVGRIGAAGSPVRSARCITVPPGGYAIFARSADPAVNGMLPPVDATFSFGLVDTSGDIQISDGATLLDQVRWSSVASGVSQQLDPAHLTCVDNDLAARFCAATTAYGDATNRGTPGAPNAPCP